jgi:hypothetical protein
VTKIISSVYINKERLFSSFPTFYHTCSAFATLSNSLSAFGTINCNQEVKPEAKMSLSAGETQCRLGLFAAVMKQV